MRFGKSVWYCNRINDFNAEIAEFNAPKEIVTRPNYFTVMQAITRGYMEVAKYGETAENTWTVIANSRAFSGKIKKGDLMWVDDEKPLAEVEKAYGNGASANAVVKNVAETNLTISITLERNQNQVLQ